MHGVGVPHLGSNRLSCPGGGEPERAADLVTAYVLREKQLERTSQQGSGSLVALRQADSERVEHNVHCAWRLGGWRSSTRSLRRGQDAAGVIEITRPQRRQERLQVRLASEGGVERREASGGAEQQPGRVARSLLLQ